MSKAPSTQATRLLKKLGIPYTEHMYRYVEHGGTAVCARELGVDEHAVIKTLVMEDEHGKSLLVLMHGDREVSTKELARQIGVKAMQPCKPEVAIRHSGYQVGGTCPLGTRGPMQAPTWRPEPNLLRPTSREGNDMLRSSLVCLGMFAAVTSPSKCGGGVVLTEPAVAHDAGATPAPTSGSAAPAPTGGSTAVDAGSFVAPADASTSSGGVPTPAGLVTLADGQTCPWGMAIDDVNVYWTDCGDPGEGAVLQVPKAGGAVITLATGNGLSGIGVSGGSVYWVASTVGSTSGTIMSVPIGGGAPVTLAHQSGAPSHLAVDETGVFWFDDTQGPIMSVPLAGGAAVTVATGGDGMSFLALDATSVYWMSASQGIMKAPKGGGAATLVAKSNPPSPMAGLAVDAPNVYWATVPANIEEAPITGGTADLLASDPGFTPGAVAVDATSVYWVDLEGRVLQVPISGGAVTTLATGQNNPLAIAVDDTGVYWLDNGNGTPGSVMKLAFE
jgi:Cys-tRNA(Pro) deacylase